MRAGLNGLLLAMGLASCPSPSALPLEVEAPPAPAADEPAQPIAAEPADEVPRLPQTPEGQSELLKEIESACDLVSVFHRHPPDLGSMRCLEQLDACLPEMHRLTLLAQSRFAEVRGKALAAAAVMHNHNHCRALPSMHPCSASRGQNELGDSALCPELAWLPRALILGLTDPEVAVRRGAAEGLMNTQVPGELLVPAARQLLREFRPGPQSAEPMQVINVLLMALRIAGPGTMGSSATGLSEELDRLLLERDLHDESVVANALHVVAVVTDRAPVLEKRVVEALDDRRRRVRLAAVEALGAIGDAAAAKHLAPLLNDRDATVRQAARAVRRRLESPFARGGIRF